MVISDLNIICINQTAPYYIKKDGIGIDIVTRHDGYGKHWKRFRKSTGIWYQFYPTERLNKNQYEDEFFDLIINNNDWYAVVYKKYSMMIVDIVNTYLALSPTHDLLFLIRIDEHGESLKTKIIDSKHFEYDLKNGQLKFNTVYHIIE